MSHTSEHDPDKENEVPGTVGSSKAKRCRWSPACKATLLGQLAAEKAAGNQTDNAGWHTAAFTACARVLQGSEGKSGGAPNACATCWGTLKAQYQMVKMLRDKSGWGWDDEEKHVVVEDSVWNTYLQVNPKIRQWRHKGFPLFDEMADLVDSAVAMGAGAFQPGQQVANAASPDWPSQLEDDDDDFFPLDPALMGAAGRFDAPPIQPTSPTGDDNSDMDDEPVAPTPLSRKRVRAMSDSPPGPTKRRRSDGHGRKPSNGHALMAVSESLQGIAAAFKADSSGPASPKRKTDAIKIIATMLDFTMEQKSRIGQLIRADTGVADTFMAFYEVNPELGIDYLRTELQG
ncbi:hypothetical protein DFH07DRAFT_957500 [Mycena maculata]|uniref:Myb/SANT-like domain-containing protein n=1 Tax=Mycena maculata TaxID=230809 RepID=A0AAD7JC05_9AGAR|nr:hypothetical protein DFH07DRAFT_957500 [Mycena maculata]